MSQNSTAKQPVISLIKACGPASPKTFFTFAQQTTCKMGISNDISQQTFRNEGQKAAINLIYTCNWLMEKMKTRLDEFDLTSQQFNILRILRGAQAPLSTMQIRERMLDKMSDTSRIVDRLILKELVQKNPCSRDKRLVDVMITEKGLALLAQLDEYAPEMDGVLDNLEEGEMCQLNKLLDKIREECAQKRAAENGKIS